MNTAMIEAIVRDYIRDKLTVSVDMVYNGDFYSNTQVPRVTIFLDGEEIATAQAY